MLMHIMMKLLTELEDQILLLILEVAMIKSLTTAKILLSTAAMVMIQSQPMATALKSVSVQITTVSMPLLIMLSSRCQEAIRSFNQRQEQGRVSKAVSLMTILLFNKMAQAVG